MRVKTTKPTILKDKPKDSSSKSVRILADIRFSSKFEVIKEQSNHYYVAGWLYKGHTKALSPSKQKKKNKNSSSVNLPNGAIKFIAKHEGLRLNAYRDSVGVATIIPCYAV